MNTQKRQTFWSKMWKTGRTGFHMDRIHPWLEKHITHLDGCKHILIPLCGKSLDLVYLMKRFDRVTGIEITTQAIEQFQAEQQLPMQSSPGPGEFTTYQTGNLTILQGDMLSLTAADLPAPVDGIWERASLIALPAEDQERYAPVLNGLAGPGCRMLLQVLEYSGGIEGPPYSTPLVQVNRLLEDIWKIETLERSTETGVSRRFREGGAADFSEHLLALTKTAAQ